MNKQPNNFAPIILTSQDSTDLGSWVQEQLTYYEQVIFDEKSTKRHFSNGDSINLANIPLGIEAVTDLLTKRGGDADVVSYGSTEVYRTTTTVEKQETPVVMIETSDVSPLSQIMQAREQLGYGGPQIDLMARNFRNMIINIEERAHLLLAFGNSKLNLNGAINHPDVPITNSLTNIYAATDASVMLSWLQAQIGSVWNNTNTVEQPNMVALPSKLMEKFSAAIVPDTGGMSVIRLATQITRDMGWDIMFVAWPELSYTFLEKYGVQSPGDNLDRMVIYSLNGTVPDDSGVVPEYGSFFARVSQMLVPPVTTVRTQQERSVAMCLSGVSNIYPLSARYVTFAKPA